MTDLRKAAEQALKYFEDAYGLEDAEVAIKEALRQALVQPEQKYVIDCPRCGHCCPEREWVGLTDEERADCWSSSAVQSAINIEQALKDKNT